MFSQDESRFGLLTVRRRRLTGHGVQPIGTVQHVFEWFYVYGAVEPTTGERFFLELPSLNAEGFQIFVDTFAQAFPDSLNLLLLDNSGAHTAQRLLLPAVVISAAHAQISRAQDPKAEIGFIDIHSGMQLRRMMVHHSRPKGVVLFLHGFPETLYAWKHISVILARDYEIHAFDWPGYGLSSRPPADQFSYAPKDYAHVLKAYIRKSGIDTSTLVIYATDIGALPALLVALDEPNVAKEIIVGDFAPFDRPQYMHASLQSLKSRPSSDRTRAHMNDTRDEILENAFRRGLSKDEQFELSQEFRHDMLRGWNQNNMTSEDAFYHYYSHFTRDQHYFESNLNRLKTPVTVIWGEKDFYIKKDMGVEFANRANRHFQYLL